MKTSTKYIYIGCGPLVILLLVIIFFSIGSYPCKGTIKIDFFKNVTLNELKNYNAIYFTHSGNYNYDFSNLSSQQYFEYALQEKINHNYIIKQNKPKLLENKVLLINIDITLDYVWPYLGRHFRCYCTDIVGSEITFKDMNTDEVILKIYYSKPYFSGEGQWEFRVVDQLVEELRAKKE